MRKIPPEAFSFYASLGVGRSYEAVATKYGVSKRSVTRKAKKEEWSRRMADMEAKARASADQNALETLQEMNSRHLKMIRVIQAKALDVLKTMPLSTAMEAVRSLGLTMREERSSRGEPGDREGQSIESIIKREHERWLAMGGPTGESQGVDDGTANG